jgi:hypothetical protein
MGRPRARGSDVDGSKLSRENSGSSKSRTASGTIIERSKRLSTAQDFSISGVSSVATREIRKLIRLNRQSASPKAGNHGAGVRWKLARARRPDLP